MSFSLYETVTNTILAALDRGVVPWRKPWTGGNQLPLNAVSQHVYRGFNVFLLSLAPYADHRWLTFKQVEQRGGRVKAGERATMVVFWKRWEPPTDEEGGSERRVQVPVLRHYNVFNAEQCEGLNLPTLYQSPAEADHQRISRAEYLVAGMPDPPRITQGASAWYRPADDLIQIPNMQCFTSADTYYSTLFHELGHSTGHPKRLNRPGVSGQIRFGSGEYSKEELVAELTSAFCCATVWLDNSLLEDSASYISGWLALLRSDPKAVVIAAAQAQRAADFIRGVQYQA